MRKALLFVFLLLPYRLYAEDIATIENKIARFSYGLRLLADYEFYDTAIYLLESGIRTSFSDFARYYIGKAYMFLGDLKNAQKYFLSIGKDFPWYEYVLQTLYYISFRMGDDSLCDKFLRLKFVPPKGVPEFYELLLLCAERNLVYLRERGREKEAEKIKEKMKDILHLYIKNIYKPVDLIPYRKYMKKVFEISLRLFEKFPYEVLPKNYKEDIADTLFSSSDIEDALSWTSDEYKLARIYFAVGDYTKAAEISEKLLAHKKLSRDEKEKLTYIALVSHARLGNREKFEKLSMEYIKNFIDERFAGDLAIKLGVEKFLEGKTSYAVKLISYALRSPFEDIRERAKFLLKYTFGKNITLSKPKGFLLLLKKYKDGFSFLKIEKEYELEDMKIPSLLAWEIYFLKLYLQDSSLSGLTNVILSRYKLSPEDKYFLVRRGFMNVLGPGKDMRSTLAVWVPPPVSFYEEIKNAADTFGVPLPLLKSIAFIESIFNPSAVSPAGAIGIMQIIPTTAKEIFSDLGVPFSVELLFDPEINTKAGAYYLKKLKNFLGSWTLAVAAYNAGPTAVSSWLKEYGKVYCEQPEIFIENIPYRQTRFYVMRALSYYVEYSKYFGYEINLDELFRCRGD